MTMDTIRLRAHLLALAATLALLAGPAAHAQDGEDTAAEPSTTEMAKNEAMSSDDSPASLNPREARMLREGRGMGMGRVAVRNGYPGPMHVLRNADALGLTEEQVGLSQSLRTRVHERAIELGQLILAAEAELDDLFETRPVDRVEMNAKLQEIAGLRAELRAVHLEAHLAQAEVLTPEQLEKMAQLEPMAGMEMPERGQRRGDGPHHQRMHRQRNGDGDGDGDSDSGG
jgi:Spy/CpxP family protein refolding chaperone